MEALKKFDIKELLKIQELLDKKFDEKWIKNMNERTKGEY
jgi:hypothetical protein